MNCLKWTRPVRALTQSVCSATVRGDVAATKRVGARRSRSEYTGDLVRSVAFTMAAALTALAALTATTAAGQGADVNARSIAATCANCHGTAGVSVGDLPSLAGRPREEIVRLMQEYKSGARTGTIMNQLAKGYTDEQIEALAGWFAARKASK